MLQREEGAEILEAILKILKGVERLF